MVDSRPTESRLEVRRRRECAEGHRFTTYERVPEAERTIARAVINMQAAKDMMRRAIEQMEMATGGSETIVA